MPDGGILPTAGSVASSFDGTWVVALDCGRAGCRGQIGWCLERSVLNDTLGSLRPETLLAVGTALANRDLDLTSNQGTLAFFEGMENVLGSGDTTTEDEYLAVRLWHATSEEINRSTVLGHSKVGRRGRKMNKVHGLALTRVGRCTSSRTCTFGLLWETQILAVVRKPTSRDGSRTCTGATKAPPSNHSPDNGC